MLAVASAIMEIAIAHNLTWYRKLATKSIVFNLIGSMLLSYTIGIMFGAGGLIAMMGGIMSTVLTLPYYLGFAYMESHKQQVAEIRQTLTDTVNMFYKILRVFTAPIRFIRWVSGVRA
jgi:hypothetical protein